MSLFFSCLWTQLNRPTCGWTGLPAFRVRAERVRFPTVEDFLWPSPASASEQPRSPSWFPVSRLLYIISEHKQATKLAHQVHAKLYKDTPAQRRIMRTVISFSKAVSGCDSESSNCSRDFISELDSKRGATQAGSSLEPWPSSAHWKQIKVHNSGWLLQICLNFKMFFFFFLK